MKIAVSSTGGSLDAMVDPRFGRCSYFVIVNVENNEIKDFEAVENPAAMAIGGAGIQAAQLVANKGVQAVITGNIGPNAFQVLSMAGIRIFHGFGTTVKDAVNRFLRNELEEITSPIRGGGFGPGLGRGFGRGGMGGGRGRML
ncbi:MAG TPA: dinitrogenase iron-molybdenum cofactor biosynthesis protein [Candidatus Altiarchaeales archaeon]|nr:dinitrogenase iron-molybdenum cofactor biosynthesis protein [Candidatus Altiarchaeales archaeon]